MVTLFPELVRGALEAGVTGRAVTRGVVSVGLQNPRDHATDAHRTVDDRPYGGGPGMVMRIEPLGSAIRAAPLTCTGGQSDGVPVGAGPALRPGLRACVTRSCPDWCWWPGVTKASTSG